MRLLRSKGFNPGAFQGSKSQTRGRGHVVKGERFKFVTAKQVDLLLNAIASDTDSVTRGRDHAAIFCGFYLGLRVGEAAILEPRHFEHAHQNVIVIPTLKQRKERKTDRPPEIQLPEMEPEVVDYIEKYLEKVRGQRWWFPSRENPSIHMSPWSLNQMFATYAAAAGLPAQYSWHSLRHGRGMMVWAATHDLKAVQAYLRHKTVEMAEKYSHMDPEKNQERLNSLSQRFVQPKMW